MATDAVLVSAGVAPAATTVYRGTPQEVVDQVVQAWVRAYEVPYDRRPGLIAIAEEWVGSWQRTLETAAPADQREALIALQVAAERRLAALGYPVDEVKPSRTYFVLE